MGDKSWGGWGCIVALAALTLLSDTLPRIIGDLMSHLSICHNTLRHLIFDAVIVAAAALALSLWKLGKRLKERERN